MAAACAWGIAEGPNASWSTSGAPGVRAAPQSRGAKEFLGLPAPALYMAPFAAPVLPGRLEGAVDDTSELLPRPSRSAVATCRWKTPSSLPFELLEFSDGANCLAIIFASFSRRAADAVMDAK